MSYTLGEHLVLGFEGAWPQPEFLEFLREKEIGGVILFKRNIESREQLKELIQCLREGRGQELIVSVDHEGGRVFRLPPPFTTIPPARVFGQYYERTQDTVLIAEIAGLIGLELRAVGFNLNYAPVLDVDSCAENPIIGDRSFHQNPEWIGPIAAAFIEGFHQAGMVSCGKHFPGHGDTQEDSHLTLPCVTATQQQMQQRELIPFAAAIRAGVPTLMTAHVLYPAWDEKFCGTLASRLNREVLRDQLGFEGVLFSDDLYMKGIAADASEVPAAAHQALLAGCDALLLCHQADCQRQTYDYLMEALQQEDALSAALSEAAPRVRALLQQLNVWQTQTWAEPQTQELENKLAQLQAEACGD